MASNVPNDIKGLAYIKTYPTIIGKSPVKVFKRYFYILIYILQFNHDSGVYFDITDKRIRSVYEMMVKNEHFNEILNELGYSNLYTSNNLFKIDKKDEK